MNNLPRLFALYIGLNITEIPSDAIVPVSGNQSNLAVVEVTGKYHNLTVKSNAFQHLNLATITFFKTTIKTIEKDAFKVNSETGFIYTDIQFIGCNLTGETFQNGSFDGKNRINVMFLDSDINYLSEGAFKKVLNNRYGSILFPESRYTSSLDCSDCRNYWLIKENRQNQVPYANCKGEGHKKSLFDDDIKSKLSQKCK